MQLAAEATQRKSMRSIASDYLELTKPKVVALLVLTAWVGMILATPERASLMQMTIGLLGIGILSGAAATFNHVVDYRIDAQMARTYNRPVAKGRIEIAKATGFACLLTVVGFLMLALWVNWMTAWLTLASLVGYAVFYTMYLKRATPQNIVIGGLAGAMPPLLGWTTVTGEIHSHALLLVMIIFTWTPPHFWALAIHRRDDYARVDMPMLPVTHGIEFTKTSILLYTLLLQVVGFLPYLVGMTGLIYLISSFVLNSYFMWYAWKLKYDADKDTAMSMFKFSIIHLMLVFVVLIVDHYWKITL